MMHHAKITINGEFKIGSESFDVYNPATGKVIGTAPNCSVFDLYAAVSSAEEAFKSWSKKSDQDLRDACQRVSEKLTEHSEELATLITLEQGKPLNGLGSRWEIGGAGAWASYTASLSMPVEVIQDTEQGRIELHRKPLGVVGSITPWNFPVMIAVWHILPALRSGNTVVMKPSPLTPLAALRMVELMNEVLPAGVVNSISSNDKIGNLGAQMAAHRGIRKIVFTGSSATGQKVMESAASTMKRLTLEMGGNDAGIVLADCDPKEIAEGLFWGAFINNGQTCAALKRLYVHESIHDEVCKNLVEFAKNIPVGDGMDEKSILGPIQNQMQFDKVSKLVTDAKKTGNVLLGGEPGMGLFFPITIISGMKNGDALVDQEQFGPVLPVISYRTIEEAIQMANEGENGLGGSVWSKDEAKAKQVASQLDCGSVWINKHGAIQPNAPFGGTKCSGLGVEFGAEGLKQYTDIQVIFS